MSRGSVTDVGGVGGWGQSNGSSLGGSIRG